MTSPTDPLSLLQDRLRRVHAALASTSTFSIPVFESVPLNQAAPGRFTVAFTDGRSEQELQNALASLIANVASIKDHLNVWCAGAGIRSPGDTLINSDRSVALIHDLWNRDKHAQLTRSRSGHRPLLAELDQSLQVEPIDGSGSVLEVRTDTSTGETRAFPGPNTRLSLVIDAQIFDELGQHLGPLLATCERALDAWTATLQRVGVPL